MLTQRCQPPWLWIYMYKDWGWKIVYSQWENGNSKYKKNILGLNVLQSKENVVVWVKTETKLMTLDFRRSLRVLSNITEIRFLCDITKMCNSLKLMCHFVTCFLFGPDGFKVAWTQLLKAHIASGLNLLTSTPCHSYWRSLIQSVMIKATMWKLYFSI